MSITIRAPKETDFFQWLDLYAGYAEFYETTLTDQKALLLWSWISNPANEVNALLAFEEPGQDGTEKLVGLAHYREFARPLEGDRSFFLDDLFVSADTRSQGTGTALIEAIKEIGKQKGFGIVQWITAADNETAQKVYDAVATRTPWVTYELDLKA